ncbi:MAG: hypothetical protein AB7I25_06550 [Vicinamibacterales bacterium]
MRRLVLSIVLLAACAGCESIEVEKALVITDVKSGWYDAGVQEGGMNKLVPSISFRLRDQIDKPVSGVMINAIFRRVNEDEAWGEHFVKAIGQEGLAPGATSRPIVLRSNLGYTGTEPRLVMLKHRDFVDAKVELFAKQGRRTWVKIGEYAIARELLTR